MNFKKKKVANNYHKQGVFIHIFIFWRRHWNDIVLNIFERMKYFRECREIFGNGFHRSYGDFISHDAWLFLKELRELYGCNKWSSWDKFLEWVKSFLLNYTLEFKQKDNHSTFKCYITRSSEAVSMDFLGWSIVQMTIWRIMAYETKSEGH